MKRISLPKRGAAKPASIPADAPDGGKRSEHIEQREYVSWFRQHYPGVLIFSIPNGGRRGKAEALRLKLEGLTAGIPDLYIPAWRTWVEMKTTSGRLSADQRRVIDHLQSLGDRCIVAHGLVDAVVRVTPPYGWPAMRSAPMDYLPLSPHPAPAVLRAPEAPRVPDVQ